MRVIRQLHTSKRLLQSLVDKQKYQATTYARPNHLVLTRGKNAILYDDVNNKEYIDFTAGIAVTALGHANPEVAEIMYKQSKKLIHSSNLYYNEECLKLSENLVEATKSFGGQYDASRVFLCNSGTEANEAALKFAKRYGILKSPSKQGIIAVSYTHLDVYKRQVYFNTVGGGIGIGSSQPIIKANGKKYFPGNVSLTIDSSLEFGIFRHLGAGGSFKPGRLISGRGEERNSFEYRFIIQDVEAVSYTHLDVYKRQTLYQPHYSLDIMAVAESI